MNSIVILADPDNARALARLADGIRLRGKRVIADVIEIGRDLSKAKTLCGHGGWLPWLRREFGWTEMSTLNLMRVYELSKSKNFLDLNLSVSSIYQLCAPSTPEAAVDETISRAKAGEAIPLKTVREIVGRARQAKPGTDVQDDRTTEHTPAEGTTRKPKPLAAGTFVGANIEHIKCNHNPRSGFERGSLVEIECCLGENCDGDYARGDY
jgi:hypothetical protein